MAANISPIFEKNPSCGSPQTFAIGDASTKKTIWTAGAEGARIDSIMCSTDDTAAVNLAFYITVSGTDYYIGNVNVSIGAGYTTVARIEGVSTLAPILGYLTLPASGLLKCNCVATMTTGKTATVVPMGGEF